MENSMVTRKRNANRIVKHPMTRTNFSRPEDFFKGIGFDETLLNVSEARGTGIKPFKREFVAIE